MTRAHLRAGARASSIGGPDKAASALSRAAATMALIAASVSVRSGSGRCRRFFGLQFFLGGQCPLDARNGIKHQSSVRVTVTPGVFVQKPAAARGLDERLANGLEVRLGGRRRAGRNG